MPTQALTYVEIDIPAFTQNSPPDSPIPTTTFRFAMDAAYLPLDIDAIPSIVDVSLTPTTVSLGGNLGQRATLEVKFRDHRHVFASESFISGTFWGKFRARYGLKLRGYPMRLIQGRVGQTLADMETRNFLIESTDGPSYKGEYKIIAKDVLVFASGDRSQAPVLSEGLLLSNITSGATSLTISPTGEGANYSAGGYVAIGGKEIIRFSNPSWSLKIWLKGEGADASTTFADSSGYDQGDLIGVNGNVQIDTAQFKSGAASILFDGTGDFLALPGQYIDYNLSTIDFTIRVFFRLNATGVAHNLYDGRNNASSDVAPTIYVNSSNQLVYMALGVDRIAGGTLTTGVWYHCEASRVSGTTRLFLDGTSLGTYVDANNYAGFSSRPILAANFAGTNSLNGWMDDIQIIKGIGLHSANFTAPASHDASIDTNTVIASDAFTLIARAQFNTIAQAHNAGDRVQLCLHYSGEDVADIIRDLLITYASVPDAYIPLSAWQAETSGFLGTVYTALIAEPTAVAQLISELIEQAALAVWWDDLEQHINLQVLRQISHEADTYTQDNILEDTLEVNEQPTTRISQVYTYFAKINPLVKDDQLDNYRSTILTRDPTAETDYGTPAIKKIFSRWIPAGGRSIAETLNNKQLGRFRDPPRKFKFGLFRYAGQDPILGQGYHLQSWPLQQLDGTAETVGIQITRLKSGPDQIDVEAEEALFIPFGGDVAPTNRAIIFDANENNINLRTRHDELYPAPTGDSPATVVTATINDGVIIGSTSTSTPALDIGSWPAGVVINLIVIGRIQGKGGNGGAGGNSPSSNGSGGAAGGTALYTRFAINLTSTNGEIWSGGGGGGGGAANLSPGGGGGGGSGTLVGPGGLVGSGTPNGATNGANGTATGGGGGGSGGNFSGATSGAGGNGGGPGLGGSAGGTGSGGGSGGSGGAAGAAIDGDSFTTDIGAAGDIRGGQIN